MGLQGPRGSRYLMEFSCARSRTVINSNPQSSAALRIAPYSRQPYSIAMQNVMTTYYVLAGITY